VPEAATPAEALSGHLAKHGQRAGDDMTRVSDRWADLPGRRSARPPERLPWMHEFCDAQGRPTKASARFTSTATAALRGQVCNARHRATHAGGPWPPCAATARPPRRDAEAARRSTGRMRTFMWTQHARRAMPEASSAQKAAEGKPVSNSRVARSHSTSPNARAPSPGRRVPRR